MTMLNQPNDKIKEEISDTPILQRNVRGGFPVLKTTPLSASGSFGEEGDIVLRNDGSGNYYLYAKIGGSWRIVTLT